MADPEELPGSGVLPRPGLHAQVPARHRPAGLPARRALRPEDGRAQVAVEPAAPGPSLARSMLMHQDRPLFLTLDSGALRLLDPTFPVPHPSSLYGRSTWCRRSACSSRPRPRATAGRLWLWPATSPARTPPTPRTTSCTSRSSMWGGQREQAATYPASQPTPTPPLLLQSLPSVA